MEEAWDIGFRGPVCLQFFNEPLLDPRIAGLVMLAKKVGYSNVYFSTNGDYFSKALAAKLDGCLDNIYISLYDPDGQRFKGFFKRTRVHFAGAHITTHHSPNENLKQLIQENVDRPCTTPGERMIISSTGEAALCCEDIGCIFHLGSIKQSSIKELWFSKRHTDIVEQLSKIGGRRGYGYCKICPRA